MSPYIMAYDIGSTGCKSCLYRFENTLELVDTALSTYELFRTGRGGVEQQPEHWWHAMIQGSAEIRSRHPKEVEQIAGISFCAQMQGLVLVNNKLEVLRPAMSYMDQRAEAELKTGLSHGLCIEGMNARKLIQALSINGAIAASVKDPVWKYHWVRNHEPELFAHVYKWLDVKDYLIARATGICTMTEDSAFATFLSGEQAIKHRQTGTARLYWDDRLLSMYKVDKKHLPDIISSTDIAGKLSVKAAEELGLQAGLPVVAGGGDVSMISVGSGATEEGDTHVYTGTSGWVSCVVRQRHTDIASRIASIIGAQPDSYNYFAEQETAGKCLEWVRDHLAKDEINLYLDKHSVVDDPESGYRSMYDFLIESIEQIPPASNGVIFTPWLHGNRSPFEDSNARGIFFNLGLDTGKRAMIRAVVEGIIFHQKWLLESIEHRFIVNEPLRFVGGGALSPSMTQIMADILGKPVLSVEHPQNCGAAGAAFCAAIALGKLSDFRQVKQCIPTSRTSLPDSTHQNSYTQQFKVFKELYTRNKKLFHLLNATADSKR